MDHWGIYLILLSVGMKMFYKCFIERRGIQSSLMPGFMSRREDWIVVCPFRLLVIATVVSLFSCIEMVHQDSQNVHGLSMKFKYDDVYKSLVFSALILFGIQLKTPLLMGPWLNFTLKNVLMAEIPSLAKYFTDLPHENIVPFVVLYAFIAYILLMQIQWWFVICNYHSFLWSDILNLLSNKCASDSKQSESEELDSGKNKK